MTSYPTRIKTYTVPYEVDVVSCMICGTERECLGFGQNPKNVPDTILSGLMASSNEIACKWFRLTAHGPELVCPECHPVLVSVAKERIRD